MWARASSTEAGAPSSRSEMRTRAAPSRRRMVLLTLVKAAKRVSNSRAGAASGGTPPPPAPCLLTLELLLLLCQELLRVLQPVLHRVDGVLQHEAVGLGFLGGLGSGGGGRPELPQGGRQNVCGLFG